MMLTGRRPKGVFNTPEKIAGSCGQWTTSCPAIQAIAKVPLRLIPLDVDAFFSLFFFPPFWEYSRTHRNGAGAAGTRLSKTTWQPL
jgi:hypothetical protein